MHAEGCKSVSNKTKCNDLSFGIEEKSRESTTRSDIVFQLTHMYIHDCLISPGCRHGCLACRSRANKPWPVLIPYDFRQEGEPSRSPTCHGDSATKVLHHPRRITDIRRTECVSKLAAPCVWRLPTKMFQPKPTFDLFISRVHTHFFLDLDNIT